ncbi:hypothetical protein BGZ94_000487 [Podila epigama]|nr:hypothetical protein BGZ94_000487 [Podila epigama]
MTRAGSHHPSVSDVRHYKEEGLTDQATADALGTSASIIHEIVQKEHIPSGPHHRGRKLDDETVQELKRERESGEIGLSYVEATEQANEMLDKPVSYSTVRRRLHEVEDNNDTKNHHVVHHHQKSTILPGTKKLPDETVEELKHERETGELGSSYVEATQRANELLTDPVSYSTVRRRLHEVEDE